ncbi:MAG: hypothetical protein AB7U83_08330 [Vicinamibacterales bacterium]
MIVRRIGPLSVAKLSAALYALIGLLIGGILSLVSMAGGAMAGDEAGPMAMAFGAAAVILLPIFYACIGFVGSLIGATLYNVVAGWVGGIQLDVEQ